MAVKFSGAFEVRKRPEEVYDVLSDPNRFAALFPDFPGLSAQDSTHFMVRGNVGISFIKFSADVKMELAEADRPRRAFYRGQGTISGGKVNAAAGFDLMPTAFGTIVNWQCEAEISGRMASIANELLETLGKKYVQKVIDGLQAALT
jgi:uncharacterized protein